MANKTTQALKISASWTPNEATANLMTSAGFEGTDAAGVRFSSGRLSIKDAIAADYAAPSHAVRSSERIAAIKAALAATGELHSFNVTAGAVPHSEAELLASE